MEQKVTYDVGLVNFGFANNYGGILTAYALYKCLTDHGYKTLLIDKPNFWWPNFTDKHNEMSRRFMHQHVDHISKRYQRVELKELNNLCNAFVVGSDQIWNHDLYCGADDFVSLSFVDDNKNKISYGTSFGKNTTTMQGCDKYFFECALKRFDAISVRENSGADLLKNIFGVEAHQVLDPVFLLDKEQYYEIAQKSNMPLPKEKYLFAYILDYNEDKQNTIDELCRVYGLKKVIYGDAGDYWKNAGDYCSTPEQETRFIGVEDWLYALLNAELVFTDSYHGTCFSTLFNKQMVCFKDRKRGETRFDTLFKQLDIPDGVGCSIEELAYNKYRFVPIDYSQINEEIKTLKEESMKWLLKALQLKEPRFITKAEVYRIMQHYRPQELCEIKYSSIGELGLPIGTTIKEIVHTMPCNSTLCQVQGRLNDPIADTPVPFGVLTIIKTTDYFAQIMFSCMTTESEKPNIYQASWIDGEIRAGWTRYVREDEIKEIKSRLEELEKNNIANRRNH